MRRFGAAAAAALAAAALAPAPAFAHGLAGRTDLPIPAWLFGWGAAAVLIVSFVGLALLWPSPRLQDREPRAVARVPVALDVLAGAAGVGLFALVVYSGLAGTQVPAANFAPTFVYVVFWVGLAIATLVLGDVFRAFNPWLALARAGAWASRRLGRGGAPEPLPYPAGLGYWPAVAGLAAWGWLELAHTGRDDPGTVAILALVYAGVQLAGMGVYGIEAWSRRGDAFGVWFSLLARIAPLCRRGRDLCVRPLLSGLPGWPAGAGAVAFLAVAIGTTTFDGFSQGSIWADAGSDLQRTFADAGLAPARAIEAAFTVGLAAAILAVAAIYRIGVAGMAATDMSEERGLAGRFAHTLAPIAAAYAIAHYFSLLAFQGQGIAALASDPLGDGSDLLGTAGAGIDYAVIGANTIWYVQVGALVAGHVAALVLAHDRAVALWRDPPAATRSQFWMLAVMVAFTSLGLWLLSALQG